MHGMARPRVLFTATLLIAGAAGGCTTAPDRVSDCVPPANEERLLAEYESDPALAAAPAGAIPRGEPSRMAACYRVGSPGREGISRTTISVQYDLTGDLGPDDVRALVEPLASRGGWKPLDSQISDSHGMLSYCRAVLGTPSVLEVNWQDAMRPDGDAGRTVSGVLTTTVFAVTDADLQRDNLECAA